MQQLYPHPKSWHRLVLKHTLLRESCTPDQHTKGKAFDVQIFPDFSFFPPAGSPGTPLSPYAPNGTLLNEIFNDTKTPVKVRAACVPTHFFTRLFFLSSANRKEEETL